VGHSQGRTQAEITAAAVVAQLLGITVSPSANSKRVAEVIQHHLDRLDREITNLKLANSLISYKHNQAVAQIGQLLEQTKKSGSALPKTCDLTSPNLNSAPTSLTATHAHEALQESPEWPTRTRSKSRKTGAAAKSRKSATPSRRSKQSKREAAA
jgi:hypothetical protein